MARRRPQPQLGVRVPPIRSVPRRRTECIAVMTSMCYLYCMQNPDVADRSLVVTPHAIPWDASLTLKCRVRHPSRKTTREYWTINARVPHGTQMRMRMLTMGDFGRWAVDDRATAEAALIA